MVPMTIGKAWGLVGLCWVAACSSDPPDIASHGGRDAMVDGKDTLEDVSAPDRESRDADAATPPDSDAQIVISDVGCGPPAVAHGDACAMEAAQACGRKRLCTDIVVPGLATTCTCRGGRFDCGQCPPCSSDLRQFGCGIGQVCDGLTLTVCDGSRITLDATCSCLDRTWSCVSEAGTSSYSFCEDGGSPPDADAAIDVDLDAEGDKSDGDVTIDRRPPSDSDVTIDRRPPSDASCPGTPVVAGQACTVEGSIACGQPRSCTDVPSSLTTDCVCQSGQYWCGDCPFCNIDLRNPGCGIGQVCDGVAFTLCSGAKETVNETCRCTFGSASSWFMCASKTYRFVCADGGDAAP
jgi:hypothetical protein